MAKSLLVSYIFWILGGPFGLHHVYLRRDKQAFVWWSTFGGFVIGWFRDLFRLPDYVYQANLDEKKTRDNGQVRSRPAIFGIERCFGAILLGSFYGILARLLIPEDIIVSNLLLLCGVKLITPFGVAIGVHLVCNIGREVSSFKAAVVGAYIPALLTLFSEDSFIFYMAISAFINIRYQGVEYVESPRRHPPLSIRCLRLWGACTLYLTLFSCILLFNVSVVTETGEKIPLRTAAYNFLHSKAWRDARSTLSYLRDYWVKHGMNGLFNEVKRMFDTSGIGHALEVLEVEEWMSEEEITKSYRRLAKQWHPDKFRTEEEKTSAQERFMEIQTAWETISTKKARREMKSRSSRSKES